MKIKEVEYPVKSKHKFIVEDNKDTYICYAPIDMEFTSADPETQVAGDCIKWENKLYEVTTASKWNNAVLPHWELVCVRKKEGEK